MPTHFYPVLIAMLLLSNGRAFSQAQLPENLPVLSYELAVSAKADWLLNDSSFQARAGRSADGKEIIFENGLIRRSIRVSPNGATAALDDLRTGSSLLRAVKPEALLTIDGKGYPIGGLFGQRDQAYLLPEWIEGLTNKPGSFQLTHVSLGTPRAPMKWVRKRHSEAHAWPPRGIAARFDYSGSDDATRPIAVSVHYEFYDGLPAFCKWLTISNASQKAITINTLTTEMLAAVEAESAVDQRPTNKWRLPPMAVLSDYSFGGMDPVTSSKVADWQTDPDYMTQVHFERKTPALLVSHPPIGPGIRIEPGSTFESFKSWVVVFDSDSRERQGLTLRRVQRAIAPWITENPLMMHVRNADTKTFRNAVDQCAAVGFEMIIYTFGSGLNMENTDPAYMAKIKEDIEYAHSKGIEVGAYSLMSARSISPEVDAISPKTGKPGDAIFGSAPCFATEWGIKYFAKLKLFIESTGLDLLEHDGPYPGDLCASTKHAGHQGLENSQYRQWQMTTAFYKWCRERGMYINAPDYYFLAGANKTGMGYREDNWSLPRAQQLIHGRQHIFDGTWDKTPTMGWTFVPLTEYHGGGAAATLEPLKDHLDDYAAHLANNLGAGVQACYRGPRLYDSDATREMLAKWVAWFKDYRDILESDIIHLRRADGRDLDYVLHVNPKLKRRGLLMVYNPLGEAVERKTVVPLKYTGLTEKAIVREQGKGGSEVRLDREYKIEIPLRVPAHGNNWWVIETPEK